MDTKKLQPPKNSKSGGFFRSHPWQSAIAALLVIIVVGTTIGSQLIQTSLSADNYKNKLQKQAAQYLEDANEYIALGNFDRAMEALRLFLNLYPEDAEGYLTRASIYAGKGQYEKAIEDMNHLIALESDNADYYLQRGCLYILLDDFDSAQANFDKAITLDSSNQELLLIIGQIYCEKEDYDSALKTYDQYLSIYPDSAEIFAQEAYVYSLTEDYVHAAEKLRSAYDIAPSYEYSAALAQTYAAAGDYAESVSFCNLALAEDDSDDTLCKLLADSYYLQADYENALKAYAAYLDRVPKDEEAAYQQCICYLQLNQLENALDSAKTLLTFASDKEIVKNTQDIVTVLEQASEQESGQ